MFQFDCFLKVQAGIVHTVWYKLFSLPEPRLSAAQPCVLKVDSLQQLVIRLRIREIVGGTLLPQKILNFRFALVLPPFFGGLHPRNVATPQGFRDFI